MGKLKTLNLKKDLYFSKNDPKFVSKATYEWGDAIDTKNVVFDAIRACYQESDLTKKQFDDKHFSTDCKIVLHLFEKFAHMINLNIKDENSEQFLDSTDNWGLKGDINSAYHHISLYSGQILKNLNYGYNRNVFGGMRIKREDIDAATLALQIKWFNSDYYPVEANPDFMSTVNFLKDKVNNWQKVLDELKGLEEYDPIMFKDHVLTKTIAKEILRSKAQGTEM